MKTDDEIKRVPWHRSFQWWHVLLVAQGALLLNIGIIVSSTNGEGAGILSWIWLIGTIYGIYLFFTRNKTNK